MPPGDSGQRPTALCSIAPTTPGAVATVIAAMIRPESGERSTTSPAGAGGHSSGLSGRARPP
jgi:hypothetical protein